MKVKNYMFPAMFIMFLVMVTVAVLAAEGEDGETTEVKEAPRQVAVQPLMTERAWGFLSMAIAISIPATFAALALGRVCSAAIGAIAEKPEIAGSTIIYIVFIEALAIYGLTVSFMIFTKL